MSGRARPDLQIAVPDKPPEMPNAECRKHPELPWVQVDGKISESKTVLMQAICHTPCEHLAECRSYAIVHGEHGMWGGMNDAMRGALKRRRR